MQELPSHWIFSHLCWVQGLFSILTSTVIGMDTASYDIQGKKHPAGHKTWNHHMWKRCQPATQPGSRATPGTIWVFLSLSPKRPGLTPLLLGRADKIAAGGGVAAGQVTWVLIKETLWRSQVSSCPQPTVPESAHRERTASTASFLVLGAGLWVKCILLENKNTFLSPFFAPIAQP